MTLKKIDRTAVFIFCLAVLTPAPASAYFDASIATMVLQSVVAGIAGGLVVIKLYWTRIRGFFSREKDDVQDREIED